MTKSTYSFCGSKVHLQMKDDLADAYNGAVDAWFQAQKDFEKEHGRKPTQMEVLTSMPIRANGKQASAWNKVSNFMNGLYKNGLELRDEDCPEDHLIKL